MPKDTFDKPLETALEHAWSHFQYHAGQRLQMVRYFLILYAFLFAGVVSFLNGDGTIILSPLIGVVLGIIIVFAIGVFRRLDRRNEELIELSEKVIEDLEAKLKQEIDEDVFSKGSINIIAASNTKQNTNWKYGHNLPILFTLCYWAAGLLIIFALLRLWFDAGGYFGLR